MAQISWVGRAVRDLKSLPERDKKFVSKKITALKFYPDLSSLDVKKLTDQNGLYRLRAGNYRVIFELSGENSVIIEIQRILRRTSVTY